MSFVPVDPDKTGLTKDLADEYRVRKLESGKITLPTKELHVVDPTTQEVVGVIEYPLDFCPMDKGACSQGGDADGFYHVGGDGAGDDATPEIWIHSCYRPTRKWFTGHIKRVVKFKEGYTLPW